MSNTSGTTGLSTKLFYGFGAVANGVKSNGFSYFLLLFYQQVVGLEGYLFGIAMFIVMACDAISDPFVGHISDNWHSKWGRRHPFMYFAAVPVAVSYYFLWAPPEGMSQTHIFFYLIVLAVLVRTFITMYEVPSTSLAPEFTDDYDQRTSFLGFRFFFGWWGGLTIAVLGYLVFFKKTPEYEYGQLNPDAWPVYGAFASIIIFLSIIISTVGTHRHIPNLKSPPVKTEFAWGVWFRQFFETLSNRNFLVVFISAILMSIGSGINTSLVLYINTYFWELPASLIGILNLVYFLSAALALILTPIVSRGRDKQHVAVRVWLTGALVLPLPVVLRLIGLFPGPGSDWLLPMLMLHGLIDVMLIIMGSTLISSMIADIVEDSAKQTGRRSEALFFAGDSFARKIMSGLGVMSAGVILSIVGFSKGATPGEVPTSVLHNLVYIYVPLILVLYCSAVLVLKKYKITRAGHAENVRLSEVQALATAEKLHQDPFGGEQ